MNLREYAQMYEVEGSHWWYVGLHELLLGHVSQEAERLGRPLRIFDAGCGTGRLAELLAPYGEVTGCDAEPEAIRHCRLRGVTGTFLADLNELQPEEGAYDVVTSIDVLYHRGIRDDVAVLKRLHAALRPGGLLLLHLVAHEFLRSSHDVAVHTRERYTCAMVIHRLTAAGFSADFVSYRICALFPLIVVWRLLGNLLHRPRDPEVESDVRPSHPLVNRALLGVLRGENLLLKRRSLPFGTSVFASARKAEKG